MSQNATKMRLEDLPEVKPHLITQAQRGWNAKQALIDSGLLAKDFSSAAERRKALLKCTTGSSNLDSFLKGGIETQAMTEIA